ncbi:unnamed protein product [Calypogeia fissa]
MVGGNGKDGADKDMVGGTEKDGIGASGSGGTTNETAARLTDMVYQHLSVAQLSEIDLGAPEGRASLATIFGEVLRDGLATREEEKRKATEEKRNERKRNKEEQAKVGVLSPQAADK